VSDVIRCVHYSSVSRCACVTMNCKNNLNVSYKPRRATGNRKDIATLYVVNRFCNVRSDANQKAACCRYFGFLFYHAGKKLEWLWLGCKCNAVISIEVGIRHFAYLHCRSPFPCLPNLLYIFWLLIQSFCLLPNPASLVTPIHVLSLPVAFLL